MIPLLFFCKSTHICIINACVCIRVSPSPSSRGRLLVALLFLWTLLSRLVSPWETTPPACRVISFFFQLPSIPYMDTSFSQSLPPGPVTWFWPFASTNTAMMILILHVSCHMLPVYLGSVCGRRISKSKDTCVCSFLSYSRACRIFTYLLIFRIQWR